MPVDVDIPELGESVTEAILVEWLKAEGDVVEADEPICVLETDKADVELPSPASGNLIRLKSDGETILVGETIARIDDSGAAPAPASATKSVEQLDEKVKLEPSPDPSDSEDALSPAVRRLVTENNLDPSSINGTGKEGRLTKAAPPKLNCLSTSRRKSWVRLKWSGSPSVKDLTHSLPKRTWVISSAST